MGYELYSELSEKTRLLDVAVRELRDRGRALAQAEADYRKEKAKAILEERRKGTPVTIIADLVKGREDIALLCFKRDCAEVVYKSAQEAINALKLEIRIINGQIEREWGQAGSA